MERRSTDPARAPGVGPNPRRRGASQKEPRCFPSRPKPRGGSSGSLAGSYARSPSPYSGRRVLLLLLFIDPRRTGPRRPESPRYHRRRGCVFPLDQGERRSAPLKGQKRKRQEVSSEGGGGASCSPDATTKGAVWREGGRRSLPSSCLSRRAAGRAVCSTKLKSWPRRQKERRAGDLAPRCAARSGARHEILPLHSPLAGSPCLFGLSWENSLERNIILPH
ncbi:uncharacterized protein LOC133371514 [Rhineura floridana]|uniref:uncharacterized protein LOC133371514 n=1 Tax=Rhineura floridana TaxID=261503 RepID=UPI002AC86427|nr:uncharacterized protein LOC133371514 [Rhineura floridana]